MSSELPMLGFATDGPIILKGACRLTTDSGAPLAAGPGTELCRCGQSATRPFCDGSHASSGFTSVQGPDRLPREPLDYEAGRLVVHDDRGICSHAGQCTMGWPQVFKAGSEPWIDASAMDREEIIRAVRTCPSGALAYSLGGSKVTDHDRSPGIRVSRDGPYYVTGGIALDLPDAVEAPPSGEHYALCRCGLSKNKPFCNGAHWYQFHDDGEADAAARLRGEDTARPQPPATEAQKVPTTSSTGTGRGRNVAIGALSDFTDGQGCLVEADGKRLAVFRSGDRIGVIAAECPHQGGPLDAGELVDGKVVCPLHAWEFDPFTGEAKGRAKEPVQAYKVTIEAGQVSVDFGPSLTEPPDEAVSSSSSTTPAARGSYLGEWERAEDDLDYRFARLQELAKTGQTEISAMRTTLPVHGLDAILFKGGQLARPPLNSDEEVVTETIIGQGAAKPVVLRMPFFVSHMSFGAISKEAKVALARGSKEVGTMICSGEGGLLPEERAEAAIYNYELGTAKFSHVKASIIQADLTEIKIGQAAKPGLGGHLPGHKVTEEIGKIRGVPAGTTVISPGRYSGLDSPGGLLAEVFRLRGLTGGKPIGIKISAGHLEEDLAIALEAGVDFITVDCRGGATAAGPTYVKDNLALPPVHAIRRARRFLDSQGAKVTLLVTGGFRDAADIGKALALGADAVALATSSLIAIGCQQYRVCHTGKCPVGIATQDPDLRKRLNVEESVKRFVNFYEGTLRELADLARLSGRASVHDLDLSDIFTTDANLAATTDIEHAGGSMGGKGETEKG